MRYERPFQRLAREQTHCSGDRGRRGDRSGRSVMLAFRVRGLARSHCRSHAKQARTGVRSISAAGGSAAVTMDATSETDVVKLFDRAMAPGNGREAAELVVYNAGGNQRVDFREPSAELFERFWRVGCFGGRAERAAALLNDDLHRRICKSTGQARLRAVCRRQGRSAHGRPEHRARIRAVQNPCGARRD
jgi:hypothetical protein